MSKSDYVFDKNEEIGNDYFLEDEKPSDVSGKGDDVARNELKQELNKIKFAGVIYKYNSFSVMASVIFLSLLFIGVAVGFSFAPAELIPLGLFIFVELFILVMLGNVLLTLRKGFIRKSQRYVYLHGNEKILFVKYRGNRWVGLCGKRKIQYHNGVVTKPQKIILPYANINHFFDGIFCGYILKKNKDNIVEYYNADDPNKIQKKTKKKTAFDICFSIILILLLIIVVLFTGNGVIGGQHSRPINYKIMFKNKKLDSANVYSDNYDHRCKMQFSAINEDVYDYVPKEVIDAITG